MKENSLILKIGHICTRAKAYQIKAITFIALSFATLAASAQDSLFTFSGQGYRCTGKQTLMARIKSSDIFTDGDTIDVRFDSTGHFCVRVCQGLYTLSPKQYDSEEIILNNHPIYIDRDTFYNSIVFFDTTETYISQRYITKDKFQPLREQNRYARQYCNFIQGIDTICVGYDWHTLLDDSTYWGDISRLFDFLPGLKMRKGYALGALMWGNKWSAAADVHPYAYRLKGSTVLGLGSDTLQAFTDSAIVQRHITDWSDMRNLPTRLSSEKPLSAYIDMDWSEDGIWQLFLLYSSYSYTPKYRHANYNTQYIVFDSLCLAEVFPTEGLCSCQESTWKAKHNSLLLQAPNIRNGVEIISKESAMLYYTEWSDWGGLLLYKIPVTRKDGVVEFDLENGYETRTVLYGYDCGIILYPWRTE